jgi:hypothetical protein
MNYAALVLMAVATCAAVNKTKAQLFQAPYPPTHYPPPVTTTPTARVPLHLPPVEYDHPYKGKLTTETVTLEQLRSRCWNAIQTSLGCAYQSANSCHILLVDEEKIKAAGWTVELMLRHERAHCNGWPQAHPGKRPYP